MNVEPEQFISVENKRQRVAILETFFLYVSIPIAENFLLRLTPFFFLESIIGPEIPIVFIIVLNIIYKALLIHCLLYVICIKYGQTNL